MSVETQEYLAYEEAARYLDVSMTKLYNIVSIGYLHSIRPYQAGKRRSHKRYLMVKELEAYRRGEIATVENSQLPAQVNDDTRVDKFLSLVNAVELQSQANIHQSRANHEHTKLLSEALQELFRSLGVTLTYTHIFEVKKW